ncbi:MAG: hypothetical protein GEV03_24680 [Streptosporangiales bacterium]|nr:hypothetical protein [Streptosporangiales bacterium]
MTNNAQAGAGFGHVPLQAAVILDRVTREQLQHFAFSLVYRHQRTERGGQLVCDHCQRPVGDCEINQAADLFLYVPPASAGDRRDEPATTRRREAQE